MSNLGTNTPIHYGPLWSKPRHSGDSFAACDAAPIGGAMLSTAENLVTCADCRAHIAERMRAGCTCARAGLCVRCQRAATYLARKGAAAVSEQEHTPGPWSEYAIAKATDSAEPFLRFWRTSRPSASDTGAK